EALRLCNISLERIFRNGLRTDPVMPLFKMRRFYDKIRRMAAGVLMWWTMVNVLTGGTKGEYDVCYDDVNKEYLACNPSMYDVMSDAIADIRVDPSTATCGTPPNFFRRLAPRGSVNETCNAASTTLRHPPNLMIDDNATSWWQSVNMLPGTEALNINITVSFNKTFRMNSDVIITFNSGRPNKMILEKSSDFGATWQPLQYYAKNCDDFQAQLVPGAEITADNPTAVICTNMYTETTPRAVAGRTVKLVNEDRFDLFLGPLKIEFAKFYEALELKLLDFLLFTDMRIRLIQPLTDGKTTYDMYYYAISDIQAVARCFCNLHAAVCNYTDTDIICDCEHNTMGKNCETCKPLYNERLWQKGSYLPYPKGQANPCIKCECNDHAESCTYNATYGRGICDVCLHNTRGYHCELCVLKYYPNVSLPLNDIDRCIECNCNLAGTVGESNTCAQDTGQCPCKQTTEHRMCDACKDGYFSFPTGNPQRVRLRSNLEVSCCFKKYFNVLCLSCSCNEISTVSGSFCKALGGQCQCKPGVSGRDCGICTPGYFNFTDSGCVRNCRTNYYGINNGTGCFNCECNGQGSTSLQCNDAGQCPCKDSVTGKKCDVCKEGYYGFGANGCSACNCSVSGSTSVSCNINTGECSCKNNVEGVKCSVCRSGFFNLAAYNPDGCQPCFCYNHSTNCSSASGFQSKLLQVTDSSGDFSLLFGDRHTSYGQILSLRLESESVLDLKGFRLLVLTGNGKNLFHDAPNGTFINSTRLLTYEVRLLEQNWMLDDGQQSYIPTAIDVIGILANLTKVTPNTWANGQPVRVTYLAMVSNEKAGTKGANQLTEVAFVEECTCSETTHTGGLSCQSCATGYKRENSSLTSPYSTCMACNCSRRGATDPPECNELSGVCLNCRNGTVGEHCERCAAHVGGGECDVCDNEFWGLLADGCRACNCSAPGSNSPVCNKTSGQCACASHVTGRTCDKCEENFQGLTSSGCVECDSCYSLLETAIVPLRQLETDINTNISALESKDMNSVLGPFMSRFKAAQENLNKLVEFLLSVEQSESVTRSQLKTFNQTLTSVEDRMATVRTNTSVEIEMVLSDSEGVLQTAQQLKNEVQNKTLSSYSKL
ncbi:unnamed protein product, partial [Lymnaea stagnalis]